MIVVTAGSSYLDIDAYGGCIAYAELLNLLGMPAAAVSNAPLNGSVTPGVLAWGATLGGHVPAPDDKVVLVDVSDVGYLDKSVDVDCVIEVIDHHSGFEDYWRNKIGSKAAIERVGAACTQVYERWSTASALDRMSVVSARLLLTAILDNTLNFLANVTTDRDITAYRTLRDIAELPDDWASRYFSECQAGIEKALASAIRRDTKTFTDAVALPSAVGQLVIWDGRSILKNNRRLISETMRGFGDDWALNLVSIRDGCSYLLADSPHSQEQLSRLLDVDFCDGLAPCTSLLLRKELLRLSAAQSRAGV